MNQPVVIPLNKIDNITFFEESLFKKQLSLNINHSLCIDINLLLISNYKEIADILCNSSVQMFKNRDYTPVNDEKIKVKIHTDCILFIIVCMAIDLCVIFSFIMGNRDFMTIAGIVVISLLMLKFVPYKIVFYGDRLEYKHILLTQNKVQKIYINDIQNVDIIGPVSSYGHNKNRLVHYKLNIYTNNNGLFSLRLLYEKMGDVKLIADIINSKTH